MSDETFQAAHCRSARALLGWTQIELAASASVGRMTVKRLEAGETVRPAQAIAIRRALEDAGLAFVREGAQLGDQPIRMGVVMVSGREPAGWEPSGRPSKSPDEEPTPPPSDA